MTEWKKCWDDKPELGARIVVLYGDGSGGTLYLVTDPLISGPFGLLDDTGEDNNPTSEWFNDCIWTEIPQDFELWFERFSDD